jgi:hypothetical protein
MTMKTYERVTALRDGMFEFYYYTRYSERNFIIFETET